MIDNSEREKVPEGRRGQTRPVCAGDRNAFSGTYPWRKWRRACAELV